MSYRTIVFEMIDENIENIPQEVQSVWLKGACCIDVAHYLCSSEQNFWIELGSMPYTIETIAGFNDENEFYWIDFGNKEHHEDELSFSAPDGFYVSRGSVFKFWTEEGVFEGTLEDYAEQFGFETSQKEPESDDMLDMMQ